MSDENPFFNFSSSSFWEFRLLIHKSFLLLSSALTKFWTMPSFMCDGGKYKFLGLIEDFWLTFFCPSLNWNYLK